MLCISRIHPENYIKYLKKIEIQNKSKNKKNLAQFLAYISAF